VSHNLVDVLVAYAEGLGLESGDLDMAVLDLSEALALNRLNEVEDPADREEYLGAHEEFASAINNTGLRNQVGFLLQHNSEGDVRRLLDGLAASR
jgi:hypothetical protein